ncbi:MAG: ribosome maturation factor RimM [Proteobacteria bacterium]|jgi:16S rRNA processing protein RimM|nr:ribosome maturation factor RimM [Pseudomonadota bacterium]
MQQNKQLNRPEAENNLIPMGRVVNAFGIKGWVKIKTDTHEYDSLNQYKKLYLFINNKWVLRTVEQSFVQNDIFHAKFDGVSDRDAALMLKGTVIAVPRDEFPPTDDGEYYWVDLIGLEVINSKNEHLGKVIDLMETGTNSVLVVKNDTAERLIPFIGVYVANVDLEKKQITVYWELDY